MARPRKLESDRAFSARMLFEAVIRYDKEDEQSIGLDVMLYWARKLIETLSLQEAYHASNLPPSGEQEQVRSQVPQTVTKNGKG